MKVKVIFYTFLNNNSLNFNPQRSTGHGVYKKVLFVLKNDKY
ncbi:hypothetical protein P20495_3777 [Pseudoalteromonas sp. BSi20495]|nr:hypothetical protein P20495_3777 [Pseudoalteromonas sp. BSi20495]